MKTPWPRLTETLPGPDKPELCRCCGEPADDLWREHGDNDESENRHLWLCKRCSDREIEPHPRLYSEMPSNGPAPGAMRICFDCVHRASGGRCVCPKAKANGGPGILINTATSSMGFIDGRGKNGKRWGRSFVHYAYPPTACTGKEKTG